jgi:hypothetical protein
MKVRAGYWVRLSTKQRILVLRAFVRENRKGITVSGEK